MRKLLAIGMAAGFLAVPATATAKAPRCSGERVTISATQPGYWRERCAGNVTPHVGIDKWLLLTASLSDHAQTITFYGDGAMVRLHQSNGWVSVIAETLAPRAHLAVWFTR